MAAATDTTMEPIRILYEDAYLVLCVKPVGVLSEDSDAGACMPALLRQHYRAAGQNDYIATVHRLDRLGGHPHRPAVPGQQPQQKLRGQAYA